MFDIMQIILLIFFTIKIAQSKLSNLVEINFGLTRKWPAYNLVILLKKYSARTTKHTYQLQSSNYTQQLFRRVSLSKLINKIIHAQSTTN